MVVLLRSLLLLASAVSCLAAPSLVRVWPEYRQADYFERLGEYFGGTEAHPGRTVLRSQTDKRQGFYFLVRVDHSADIPASALWRLELVHPGSPKVQTRDFPLPDTHTDVYEIGFTGSDWPDSAAGPLAWRLSLLDASGTPLLSRASKLWK